MSGYVQAWRNAEGAWCVSALVCDPRVRANDLFRTREWFETRTYYAFQRHEAIARFREHVKGQGWTYAQA